MIGKLIRALVGRSMAKKRGFNPYAGAAVGLLAPIVIKRGGSLIRKGGPAAVEARRRRRGPQYLRKIR